MTSLKPLFALRGKNDIFLTINEWTTQEVGSTLFSEPSPCPVMKFSSDGRYFAYCDLKNVYVVDTTSWKKLCSLNYPRTSGIQFSPNGKYLCTFESFRVTKNQPENYDDSNMRIWKIGSWECVFSTIQKKVMSWQPDWSSDSNILGRLMTNNVFFYENENFKNPVHKLHIEKLKDFSISPNVQPPIRVACFVAGSKGSPSSVRMFQYPNVVSQEMICFKSFFNADTVQFLWNSKGTAVLAKVMTDVDATGESYYGGQTLYFMDSKGNSVHIQLSKKGPMYNVAWNPNGDSFCVVYGYQPACASIFDIKADSVHTFGPSPKNAVYFNPHGNLAVFAGFGNLRGTMEVWDYKKRKQLASVEANDTTWFQWCPDGQHFITATTSPRLRVNNGYKIWHYSGKMLVNVSWQNDLYDAIWQPLPPSTYPEPVINANLKFLASENANSKPKSYVPPHARGRTDYNPKLVMEEDVEENLLSKSALRNKKKREGKKHSAQTNSFTSEQNDALSMATYLLNNQTPSNNDTAAKAAPVSEIDKKIKNIKKKLLAIDKLKQQEESGKTLEKNQMDKIASENDLIKELEKLQC